MSKTKKQSRCYVISVRLNEEEKKQLDALMTVQGKMVGDVVRNRLFGKHKAQA